jgi:hypothetical protein
MNQAPPQTGTEHTERSERLHRTDTPELPTPSLEERSANDKEDDPKPQVIHKPS